MLSLLFILSLGYTYAQDQPVAVSGSDTFRAFAAISNGPENSISVAGAKLTLTSTGDFSGNAALDAAGFKMVCGGNSQQLAFGAAAISATASVDWTPSSNGNSVIFSLTGAWAEVMVGCSNLFLYKDRDGVKGFQYSLGANQFDCNVNNGLDCICAGSAIDLGKDLQYTPLSVTKQSCNLTAEQGYNSNCTIWTLTSTGYLAGIPNTNVIVITLKLANQKLSWGGNTMGPDFGKVGFTITYPWALKGQTAVKDQASVGMSFYIGGRAGTAGAQGGSFLGKDAVIFASDNQHAAILAWDPMAQIDGVDTYIYVNSISGSAVTSYDCSGCDVVSLLIITGWKIGVAVASLGGWTSQLVIVSWPGIGPDTLVYDPVVGMGAPGDYTTNSGLFLMPSFLTMMACLVFYRFFSK